MVSLAFLTLVFSVGALRRQTSLGGAANSKLISGKTFDDTQKAYVESAKASFEWMQEHFPKALTPPSWDEEEAQNGVFWQHAQEAWKIKYNMTERLPWTAEYDDTIFLDYVLPITHFDEKPEPWMKVMREHMLKNAKIMGAPKEAIMHKTEDPKSPRIDVDDHSNLREVAQQVVENWHLAFGEPNIVFKGNQTPGVLSPLSDVLVKRYGSCTAMSIFLSDALRSLGVPSRVVGIAEWNTPEGGNHNWVEAYFDKKWNFIDAVPGTKVWNSAWFTEMGRAQKSIPHSIHQIATPIWDGQNSDTQYHVTWSKNESKWANELGGAKVFLNLPALDRTEDYKAIPSGHHEETPAAQYDGSRLTAMLSVLPVLAVALSL